MKTTQLNKMKQLVEGLKMIGGWQHDVIDASDLAIDELECIAEHVNDLDELAKKIEDNDYRVYHVSGHSYAELAQELEANGVFDIEHVIKNNDFYFDYKQLSRDMDYGGDWSEMAWRDAEDIVDGHNDYIEHLPTDLQEKIKEYWKDMTADNDNELQDELHEWIMENEQTDEWKQEWMEELTNNSDAEWLTRYFDYEAYGRDLVYNGSFYETDNGFIEII